MSRALGGHRSGRARRLRAAVLGADDAIVSIASLMIGVAASSASKEAILGAGVAGLVAGSMSVAVVSMCPSAHSATRSRRTSSVTRASVRVRRTLS